MIHDTAEVDPRARLGQGTIVWGLAQIREHAQIGSECKIGRGAYIDAGVILGDRCKVQNFAQVFAPARIADGVFIGPSAVLTNDRRPRAAVQSSGLVGKNQWLAEGVLVEDGASIGANVTIIAGVRLGAWSMIGAGSTVVRDVPRFALVVGTPGIRIGWVGRAGHRLEKFDGQRWICPKTNALYRESSTTLIPE